MQPRNWQTHCVLVVWIVLKWRLRSGTRDAPSAMPNSKHSGHPYAFFCSGACEPSPSSGITLSWIENVVGACHELSLAGADGVGRGTGGGAETYSGTALGTASGCQCEWCEMSDVLPKLFDDSML